MIIDQPRRECADVGHSRTIGRPAKMAWEKKGLLNLLGYLKPGYQKLWHGSDFIYTKNSARPGSGFSLHKESVGAILKKMAKENALR